MEIAVVGVTVNYKHVAAVARAAVVCGVGHRATIVKALPNLCLPLILGVLTLIRCCYFGVVEISVQSCSLTLLVGCSTVCTEC